MKEGKLVLVDALMGTEDQWTIKALTVEELVNKVIEAKKTLGYGRARLVIDSLSAFWLDKPAMARRHSYFVKKVLAKWDFTIMATSQYAITTSEAFGWGIEHIADGIIRFRRFVRNGVLRRYILIEKMRQTPHSLQMHEITG
jgi:KaiC/GvpD/RAD55 family RecA-like ATPase